MATLFSCFNARLLAWMLVLLVLSWVDVEKAEKRASHGHYGKFTPSTSAPGKDFTRSFTNGSLRVYDRRLVEDIGGFMSIGRLASTRTTPYISTSVWEAYRVDEEVPNCTNHCNEYQNDFERRRIGGRPCNLEMNNCLTHTEELSNFIPCTDIPVFLFKVRTYVSRVRFLPHVMASPVEKHDLFTTEQAPWRDENTDNETNHNTNNNDGLDVDEAERRKYPTLDDATDAQCYTLPQGAFGIISHVIWLYSVIMIG